MSEPTDDSARARDVTEVLGGKTDEVSQHEPTASLLMKKAAPAQSASDPGADPRPLRAEAWRGVELPLVERAHYKLMGEHARGGIGRIVRARDLRTGRIVAIKEMLVATKSHTRRFAREALITANLQHPAIVPVYELGRWPTGEPFFAMKLVAGKPLSEVLRGAGSFAERLARLPMILSVAEALAYAHRRRIIHRDIKPANVLVGDYGETVVVDWGLAKSVDPGEAAEDDDTADSLEQIPTLGLDGTVAGTVLGTPSYMAPEQARGEALDERADVYAIGAILYHLIAGKAPYADLKARDAREVVRAAASAAPTPLATVQPEAPADLLAIAAKAMARERDARYPTAGELAEDLRRFLTGQLVSAHHYSLRTLLARWIRRHRAAVTVGAVLVVLLAIVGALGIRGVLVERDRAEAELATVLYEKGRVAEGEQAWPRAAMYYAASRRHHDTPASAWAAGLAEAHAVMPSVRYLGHGSAWVHAVAIAPDGERVASADEGGELRLWSPHDGKTLGVMAAHTPLYAVAFSPDGSELAIAGDDGTIRRYDAKLAPRGTLAGHKGRIWSLAYSPDGAWLASGGEDALVKLWSLKGGPVRELAGHTQRVYSVAFSPDGTRLASGSDDRHVWVWSVADGKGAPRGEHLAGGIRVVAFAGDTIITTGWDHEIRLWRANETAADAWSEAHIVHGAAVSPHDDVLVTGGELDKIHAWDLSTHQLVMSLDAPGGQTSAVAFSRDGRWLVTAGKSAPIAWDARAFARLGTVGHRDAVAGLAFLPDGKRFVSGSNDHTLRVWDAATATEQRRIATRANCGDGVVALAHDELVAPCDDKVLRRWDATGRERDLPTDAWLRFAAVSPDLSTLAAGHSEGRLALFDLASWTQLAERTLHQHHIYDVRYAADGRLVTAGLDGHVRVWHDRALANDLDVATGNDEVLAGALSPDGHQLAAGGQDGAIDVWDVARSTWIAHRRDVANGTVWKLIYTPDGSHAITAHDDGKVRVWPAATWDQPVVLDAGEGAALSLAIEGTVLVAGYRSGAIGIWDLATHTLRHRIGGRLRERGSCAEVATQTWSDAAHAAVVENACKTAPAAYADGLAARSHQRFDREVDVVWDWQ